MKLAIALVALIGLTAANPRPQLPTPDTPPPPLSSQEPQPVPESSTTSSTSTSTSKDAPPPVATREPPVPEGSICECGYTYCASVLMGMKKPWSQKQLAESYCKTPHASCNNNVPATNTSSALYICLCDDADQKVGTHLDLVCGCDKCLNIGPDFRGRCETPCHGGNCQMEL
ncbi:hypothetical protein TRIATDRAFT_77489 [Trichoderma atroviride IMI 206040]|uniref:SSCRP protein n=1 Tax=Hypocrea atroviridis (strain ATCC 20476 / IMI 206040) TaxID=452589 RepID=G9P5J0_HYPAI|nr:uncharacterized protein TRIATDRAFT_77489 [Trichoderma atroviride IMI 206040]EHK42303.1 hypothetical protein TRIATDRAFT_77489 [Trichoderma atroviride IMI 206040]